MLIFLHPSRASGCFGNFPSIAFVAQGGLFAQQEELSAYEKEISAWS